MKDRHAVLPEYLIYKNRARHSPLPCPTALYLNPAFGLKALAVLGTQHQARGLQELRELGWSCGIGVGAGWGDDDLSQVLQGTKWGGVKHKEEEVQMG